jgi:hypothetical protein
MYTLLPLDGYNGPKVIYHEGAQNDCSVEVLAPANGVVIDLRTATLVVTVAPDSDATRDFPSNETEYTCRWSLTLIDAEERTTPNATWIPTDGVLPDHNFNVREFRVQPQRKYVLSVESPGYRPLRQEIVAPMLGERKQCLLRLTRYPEISVRLKFSNLDATTVSSLAISVHTVANAFIDGQPVVEGPHRSDFLQIQCSGELSDDGSCFVVGLPVSPGIHLACVTAVTINGARCTSEIELDLSLDSSRDKIYTLTMTPRAE